jgi:multidrug resistance efflux pump
MLVSDNYGRTGQESQRDFTLGTAHRDQGGPVNRRNVILGSAALVTVALAVGLIVRVFFSGPPPNRMLLAGDVRSVVRTISAPAISYPTVTYSVQVVSNAAMGEKTQTLNGKVIAGPQASATTSATMGAPVVSGRLSAVNVQVGDRVTTGTVVAQLDTATLDLGVAWAKITAEKTKNSVKVLNNSIDTIISNQNKLSTGWSQLATGKKQLATGKAQLATAKATLLKAKAGLLATQTQLLSAQKNRSQLEATLAALKQQAATFPPGNVPPALTAQIAKLEGLLASIDPGLAKVNAGLAQVNAGLATVAAGEASLKTGAAALATAGGKLVTAGDALVTAKKQVLNARNVTRIIADNADIPIAIAEAKRAQATLVSPVSGVVTQAATTGQVVIVGAPVVRVRPDERRLIDTYVSGEQLDRVRIGSPADISYDSSGGKTLHATVAAIGSSAQYPPTSFPTDIVHMTRTVKVTLRLDSGEHPPEGTPVDIAIHTD